MRLKPLRRWNRTKSWRLFTALQVSNLPPHPQQNALPPSLCWCHAPHSGGLHVAYANVPFHGCRAGGPRFQPQTQHLGLGVSQGADVMPQTDQRASLSTDMPLDLHWHAMVLLAVPQSSHWQPTCTGLGAEEILVAPIPPPPPGRCFNVHSGRGGGAPPWTPSPPPPSALIHLRIRVLGTFFRLGQFFPPAPPAHL